MIKFKRSVFAVLNKRNLTDSTKANYYLKLNKLRQIVDKDATTLDFLAQTEKVAQYIDNLDKSATQKSLYITIYSIIKRSRRFKANIKNFYKEQMEKFRDVNNDERLDNVIIEKDKNNWIDAKILVDIPRTVEKKIVEEFSTLWLSESKFKKLNKRLKQKYLGMILDYVILFLHTQREPLRLDLAILPVEWNSKNNADKDYNLLNVHEDNMTLYLNDFKNIKKLGKQQQKLDDKTVAVLKKWFKYVEIILGKVEYLLYNLKGALELEPFTTRNAFGKRLTGTFEKYSGKRISITLLRRIYETSLIQGDDYKQMTNRQKAEAHKRLLHGFNVAQEYNRVIL